MRRPAGARGQTHRHRPASGACKALGCHSPHGDQYTEWQGAGPLASVSSVGFAALPSAAFAVEQGRPSSGTELSWALIKANMMHGRMNQWQHVQSTCAAMRTRTEGVVWVGDGQVAHRDSSRRRSDIPVNRWHARKACRKNSAVQRCQYFAKQRKVVQSRRIANSRGQAAGWC